MPYVMLYLNRLWWMAQTFLMLHLQMLATYCQCLSIWMEGDRVTCVYVEQSTYTAYHRNRMEEHMGCETDTGAGEASADGDDDD